MEKRKPFLIICVNIPPEDAVHVLETLSTVLKKCIDGGLDVILLGDVNHDQLRNTKALSTCEKPSFLYTEIASALIQLL